MCSRFAMFRSKKEILEELTPLLWEQGFDFASNWNVTPTTTIPVLLWRSHQRMIAGMRWGLTPGWQKGGSQPLINARVETVKEKPSFRDLMGVNQCVIIMDGYYEWKNEGKIRRPYYINRPDGRLLLAAGLWQGDEHSENQPPQVTMITRTPLPQLAGIHDRMPLLLTHDSLDEWCSGTVPPGVTETLAFELKATPVSSKVNSVRAGGPMCIEPAEEQLDLF